MPSGLVMVCTWATPGTWPWRPVQDEHVGDPGSRQPGEAQAGHRTGDGEPGTQDDMGGAVIHGIESRFAILTGTARFLVAAHEKYCVVRSGGDHQQRQQIRRIGRQPDHAGVAEKSDQPSSRGHFDEDRCEHEQRGEHRAIDEKQHQRDHPNGDRGVLW